MTQNLAGTLCQWSKTIDRRFQADYIWGGDDILAFVKLDDAARREQVRAYSDRYCIRNFEAYHACGIYLLFRLAFDLPQALPRSEASVFGGWLHPSVGEPDIPFDLSWPVRVDGDHALAKVARFQGYTGKGYDALGEYEYFMKHFKLRTEAFITRMLISSE